MRNVRILLLLLLGLIACAGLATVLLASIGDAGVIASTAGVHQALEAAGLQDNGTLRNDLYAVVLRLQRPWSLVQMSGILVSAATVVAFATVWRKVR